MKLYSGTSAQEFSNTRYKEWEGWDRAVSKIEEQKTKDELKILDLGCGNGRFLNYLVSLSDRQVGNFQFPNINYTGIDNSAELLEIAAERFKSLNFLSSPSGRREGEGIRKFSSSFIMQDLENEITNLQPSTFNLIVAFGLMHHISTFEKRKKLLEKAVDLLSPGGILIVTFWQFANNEKFLKSHTIKNSEQLGTKGKYSENDYLLSFGKEKAERFCHHFVAEEIDELYADLQLKTLDSYNSDGIENKMNYYNISQKI